MDARPRNLRAMLSESTDLSELMVDLAYAALYFGDPDMAEEVDGLEEKMSDLVHDMRAGCVLAARPPKARSEERRVGKECFRSGYISALSVSVKKRTQTTNHIKYH